MGRERATGVRVNDWEVLECRVGKRMINVRVCTVLQRQRNSSAATRFTPPARPTYHKSPHPPSHHVLAFRAAAAGRDGHSYIHPCSISSSSLK
ncbi:unnamed protein product [Onchocerca flexuosa]|uniref:Uncharacterized protein n=1 Tax=Onchocerca flexuosa TaxID=387005 RepID=A0A183HJ02_9BILA|nr:unnamed protein product [Onchocerca flexuosa]